jgi:glycogen synthase
VGGLGDVVAGLGKALQRKGHLVEIILPKYDCMQYDRVRDLRALDTVVESYFDGKLYKNKIWIGTVEGEETFSFLVFVSFGFQNDLKFLSIDRFTCTFH